MKKWIIRSKEGLLTGPISTKEMLIKISEGEISGDEEISSHPNGSWKKVSQEPQFYDFLLKVLFGEKFKISQIDKIVSNNEETKGTASKIQSDSEEFLSDDSTDDSTDEETQSTDQSINQHTESDSNQKESLISKKTKLFIKERNHRKKKQKITAKDIQDKPIESFQRPQQRKVVRLYTKKENIKTEKQTKKTKGSFFALLFLVTTIFLVSAGAYVFFFKKEPKESILILPQFNKKSTLSESEVSSKIKRAFIFFSKDQFSQYLKAQKELVAVVEGDPKNQKSFGWLCMTYLELWPNLPQSSIADLNIVERVRNAAILLDPYGVDGATCDIVYNIVRKNWKKALDKTELILNRWGDSDNPPVAFYYFKARLLVGEKDYLVALNYINSLQELAPSWVKAFSYECEVLKLLGRWDEAAAKYRLILKSNPNHSSSRINLALIQFNKFDHKDLAVQLIEQALSSKERLAPLLLLEAYIVLGKIYAEKGQRKKSLSAFRNAQKISPLNPYVVKVLKSLGLKQKMDVNAEALTSQSLLSQGDQFAREGNCSAAQTYYKSAYEANKKNALAAMKAAECLWTLGLSNEAILWVRKGIQSEPKRIESYVVLAGYYAERKNFKLALSVLSRVKSVSSKNHEVYKAYSKVELARGNYRLALKYAFTARKIYEVDEEIYVLIARAQLLLGNNYEAFASATKAVELNGANKESHIIYAKTLGKIQGIAAQKKYLSQKISNNPLEIKYRIALGNALIDDEQFKGAVRIFEQVTQLNSRSQEAWMGLGDAYQFANQLRLAQKAFLRAAVLAPLDPEPLMRVGRIYLATKKYRESMKYFEQAISIDSEYPKANYYLGRALLATGQSNEAIVRANMEKQNNPNLEHSYILLGQIYTKQKKFQSCVSEYQKIFNLRSSKDPRNAKTYVNLSICYRKLGNLAIAKDMLREAQVTESGLPEIFKEFGVIFELEGQKSLAVEAYEKYLILNPRAPDAGLIRKRLNSIF